MSVETTAPSDSDVRMPSLVRELKQLFAFDKNGHMSTKELAVNSAGFGLILLTMLCSVFRNPAAITGENGIMLWLGLGSALGVGCLAVAFAKRSVQALFDSPRLGAACCALNGALQFLLLVMGVVPKPFDIAVSCVVGPLLGITLGAALLYWAHIFVFMYVPDIATCSIVSVGAALLLHVVLLSRLPDGVAYVAVALMPLLAAPLTYWSLSEHAEVPDIEATTKTYYDQRHVWPLFVYKVGLPQFCVGVVTCVFLTYAHESNIYSLDVVHTVSLIVTVVIAGVIANFGIYGVRRTTQSFARFLSVVIPPLALVSIPLAPSAALGEGAVNMSLLAAMYLILAMSWTHMASATLEYLYTSTSTFGMGIAGFVLGVAAGLPILRFVPNDSPLFAVLMGLVCLFMAFGFLPPRPAPTLARSTYVTKADTLVAGKGAAGAHEADGQPAPPSAADAGRAPEAAAPKSAPGADGAPERAAAAAQAPEGGERGKGRFIRRCENIARMYLLSARETEVLILLAKGRSMSHIREELVISEGTAKTHVSHVYKKLDVHSRHELIELIESID